MTRWHRFCHMIVPSVGAMLVSALYVVVDGIFVGQGVGVEGLAAVNIAVPYLTIMTAITMMLTMGGATLSSIRFGERDLQGANRAFVVSMRTILLFAVLVALFSWCFSKQISVALGANALLLEDTATYLKYYILFSIFFCGAMALSTFVRNDGNPRLAFWAMVVGAVSNIFLDWLFIFPLQMGVKGAAIASGLGQVLACLLLGMHFAQKRGNLSFRFHAREPGLAREIMLRGMPEFVNQMGQPITILCYNLLSMRMFGEIGVSAFSVVNYLVVITVAIFIGVSQGIQPLIGFSFGERNRDNERFFFRQGIKINLLLALGVNLLMLLFGKPIIAIFNSDAQMMDIASRCLAVYDISFLFAAANIVFIIYFLAIKRTKQALVLAILRSFVCNTVFIFLLPTLLGKTFVWAGIIFAEAVVLAIAFMEYRKAKPLLT